MTETREKKTFREWRISSGLKQHELAELANSSQGMISDLEWGETPLDTYSAHRVADALGISLEQVIPVNPADRVEQPDLSLDGYSETAPRQSLQWWRERRYLNVRSLSLLSGVSQTTIDRLEGRKVGKSGRQGKRQLRILPRTRRRLCDALHVAPEKLVLPGDDPVREEQESNLSLALEQLRGARAALGKAHEFMQNDAAITFRYQDTRDSLLPEIQRELKGT